MRASRLSIFSTLSCLLAANVYFSPADAQIATDGSLGTRTTLLGPNYFIGAGLGQQRGGNLFHSFSAFNVGVNQTAVFDSGTGVTNILARVTGGGPSTINGLLTANANLFVMNPQGIFFGSGAALNVAGSFHATTADYIRLSNETRFYADLGGFSVLSAAAPVAFGFLDGSIARIDAGASTLAMPNGQSLSLIGGDIALVDSDLSVPRGRVNFASVASAGEVVLGAAVLDASGIVAKGTLRLSNTSINGAGEEAANLYIRSGQFVVENNSVVLGFVAQTTGARVIDIDTDTLRLRNSFIDYEPLANVANGPATSVTIRTKQFDVSELSLMLIAGGGDFAVAADNFRVGANSIVGTGTALGTGRAGNLVINANSVTLEAGALTALSGGDGNAGGVTINATAVSLKNGGSIISTTSGAGAGGQVSIKAHDVLVDGTQSTLNTGITAGSLGTLANAGAAGKISLDVDSLILRNGFVSSSTNGPGRGGDVSLMARSVSMSQGASITTETGLNGSQGQPPTFGAGGAIKIDTGTMQVLSGSRVSASTYGNGVGGTVNLSATQLIVDSGGSTAATGITANTGSTNIATATGVGGSVLLHANDLQLRNRGQISTNAYGRGVAGKIDILGDTVSITGGAAISAASFGQMTNAGGGNDIVIQANTVNVGDFGQITNSTTGTGSAGRLLIAAKNLNVVDGGLLQASSLSASPGAGAVGDIFISGDVVALRSGSIDARSYGPAIPGGIVLNARSISLDEGAVISATSAGSGNAGSISVGAVDSLELHHSSRITTDALNGSGGNIQAIAGNRLILRNSAISTSVLGPAANGGNIFIDPIFVVLDRSEIISRAVGGNGGNIGIATRFLLQSSDSAIDAASQLGISGHVEIVNADVNLNADIAALPVEFLNAKQWLAKSCASRLGGDVSQFTVNGRDGAYHSPFDLSASPMSFDADLKTAPAVAHTDVRSLSSLSFVPECLQARTY